VLTSSNIGTLESFSISYMNSMGEGESLIALMTTEVASMQMGFLYGFFGAVTEGFTAIAEEEEEVVEEVEVKAEAADTAMLLSSLFSTILYSFLFIHTLTERSTGRNSVRYNEDPSQTDKSTILGRVALMPMI
jgi:hypothetical protein